MAIAERIPPAPHAIILLANYYQFVAGQTHGASRVQSRMLLWCRSGQGQVTINGQRFQFEPGVFAFLPWEHAINYTPDRHDPFLLGGVHLIPELRPGSPVLYEVSHAYPRAEEVFGARHDCELPGLQGIVQGHLDQAPGLSYLVDYLVSLFQRQEPEEHLARQLAQIFLEELAQAGKVPATDKAHPTSLRHMLRYIDEHVDQVLRVEGLAQIGQCSPATVSRLFRRHLGVTPIRWILMRKMDRAGQLLSTTRLRVGEVGRKVGVHDPYYFSKLFKRLQGVSALEYRKRHSLV